jgi:hypothetical protein
LRQKKAARGSSPLAAPSPLYPSLRSIWR